MNKATIKKQKPRVIEATHSQKRRFKRKTVIGAISFAVILGTFFYVMNHPYLQVKEIHIAGQRTLVEDDIKQTLHKYFKERYLWSIPKSNVVLLNTEQIKKNLQALYPKIQDIDVEIDNGDVLVITIGERRAHSLWCVDKEYTSIFDEECYFADQTGLLYTRAPYFSGNVYLKNYYAEGREVPLAVGTQVLGEDFDSFFRFIKVLEDEYSIQIYRLIFADYGDVQIEISRLQNHLYNNDRPVIIFNQTDDYQTVLRNIGVTLGFATFVEDFRNKPQELRSIDVRFGDRVFYTFKDAHIQLTDELTENNNDGHE